MPELRKHRILISTVAIALLVAAMPVAAAAGEGTSLGGDDAYDPAAGGNPESAFLDGARLAVAATVSYSGDDLYDPAAGGDPESAFAHSERSVRPSALTYGGDDLYDPAAGGDPESAFGRDPGTRGAGVGVWNPANPKIAMLSAAEIKSAGSGDDREAASSWNPGNANIAMFSASEIEAAGTGGREVDGGLPACDANGYEGGVASVPGTYSGDDYYDPAAGGTPGQTVSGFAVAYGRLVGCAPADPVVQQ